MSRSFQRLALIALTAAAGGVAASTLAAQERETEPDRVRVFGVVIDHEGGDSLPGATVSLGSGPAGTEARGTRVTVEGGRFRFQGVPPGTYRITVRLEGYGDLVDTLRVPDQADLELILPLSRSSVGLRPIVVDRRLPPPVPAYEMRRRGGARFLITREDILERRPRYVSELLHRVPGGMVLAVPPYGYALRLRGGCAPGIWVDGVPRPGTRSVDQVVTPQDVEAIEVFHGFEFPVEYGVNSCGGILVWTRSGPAQPPPGAESGAVEDDSGFLGRLLRAAIVVAAVLVLIR